MTAPTEAKRPRKRAPRKPAHNAATVLARFKAKATTPMYAESYTLSPGEQRIIMRALELLDAYDAPQRGRVRFLADAYQGSGCVEIASRDTRAGRWVTHVFGPPAAVLADAIRGEAR